MSGTPTDGEFVQHAYYDEQAMAWRCETCDAVLRTDGDCFRCTEDARA